MTRTQTNQTARRNFAAALFIAFSILLLLIFSRWPVTAVQANQATSDNFSQALIASGRSPEIPQSADVYGWLVGDWELQVLHYAGRDLSAQNLKGEAHFSWVLEGRAIEDVWIMPRISERKPGAGARNNMYGTTLRVWDPSIEAWRIRWLDPVSGYEERQTGRKVGNEIVQVGARSDGTATRWRFTEITPGSFHWLGEALEPDGKTWRVEGEFLARRLP